MPSDSGQTHDRVVATETVSHAARLAAKARERREARTSGR
jgi:hypothetical protein